MTPGCDDEAREIQIDADLDCGVGIGVCAMFDGTASNVKRPFDFFRDAHCST